MDAKKTGDFIAKLRTEKGMKQKDLAAILQVSDKAISRWETGKGFPDTSLLMPLSEALGVSVSDLLAGERLEADVKNQKVDALLVETLQDKKTIVLKSIAFFFFLIGIALLLSREYVSGPRMLWVSGIAMLSICAVLFLHIGFRHDALSHQRNLCLALFLQAQALLWEALPLGAVLIFMEGPDGPSLPQTYSHFSLIPFGNANFSPLFTGILTILCLSLNVITLYNYKKKNEEAKRKIKNAALFCSVLTVLISVLPLLFYGYQYMNGASYAITMLLLASVCFQFFEVS